LVGEWTVNCSAEEVMNTLQAEGIWCMVHSGRDIDDNPQLKLYKHYKDLEQHFIGNSAYRKLTFHMSNTPYKLKRCLLFNDHNEWLDIQQLGISDYWSVQIVEI
jgi:hypothetical protein